MADELWVVRHGETEWSRSGKHTGRTDLPLVEEGERRARELAARLAGTDFDLVLTSPRRRARRTAELAGFPDAVTDFDLVEWDYGDYEGISTAEIRESDPGWTVWTHETPGGETAGQVGLRLDRLLERVGGRPGRVLVFGHGHTGQALAARWLGLPVRDGRLFQLGTATVSVLAHHREDPVVARWNS